MRTSAPSTQHSLALCMCQNAKGEEFVVSWVQRGACSVLPKKRSGCLAFQQLMTQLDHPYIMPCVAAAYVEIVRRLFVARCAYLRHSGLTLTKTSPPSFGLPFAR
jgi:hypothetical protein